MAKALTDEENALARELIEQLAAAGKTDTEIATLVRRSQPVVSRIRDGAGTTFEVLRLLCDATGRPVPGARTVEPDPGQARPFGDQAWQALAGVSHHFAAFARGRLAEARGEEAAEKTKAALGYAAEVLPRNYQGGYTAEELWAAFRDGLKLSGGAPPEPPPLPAEPRPEPKVKPSLKERAAALKKKG